MRMLSIKRHNPIIRRFCPETELDLFARGFFQRQIFGQCVQREIAALRGFDIGLKRAASRAAEHEHLHDAIGIRGRVVAIAILHGDQAIGGNGQSRFLALL